MKNQIKKANLVMISLIIMFLAFSPLCSKFLFAENIDTSAVNDLSGQIENKKGEIDKLKKQTEIYKSNIAKIQKEALSLKNELAILENQLAKSELDIQSTEVEIDKAKLEMEDTKIKIEEKEQKSLQQKGELSEYIRILYKNDNKNYLSAILASDSFSKIFDQIKYTEDLQIKLQTSLNEVQSLKKQLEEQYAAQENQKNDLETLKKREEEQKEKLEDLKQTKLSLIGETENNETKFYNLYWQSKQEQSQIDNELYNLEKKLRAELQRIEEEKKKNQEEQNQMLLSSSGFIWPVADYSRGLSSTFHDPDYPFRYLFEHPGVDIRAYQGTPIRAVDNGYVARAKNAGMGYSYIMLIHADGFSSVFGHVSKIIVKEESYVTKGQIIGYSGGMPGTSGAGKLTTGPHLHFEIRLNGIPVNPLDYLP